MREGHAMAHTPVHEAQATATRQRLPRRPAVTKKRLRQGAENAARCMAIQPGDRVFLITDDPRMDIAALVAEACQAAGAEEVTARRLEEYGTRPITYLPEALRGDIERANPTVTYFIATTPEGELGLRQPLRTLLVADLKVRHGHMVGITPSRMLVRGWR